MHEEVQPAEPVPRWTTNDATIRHSEITNVQNDSMFSFGNAMSRAPIMSGMHRFPNAPIIIGVIAKKIMIRPCIVNSLL